MKCLEKLFLVLMFSILLAMSAVIPACAIGKLEDAADALENAEKAIDDLHIQECMSACDEDAEACFDYANNDCVDLCEGQYDVCETGQDECIDIAREACSVFSDAAYDACMAEGEDACDYDCDNHFSDCGQECGNALSECFFGAKQNMDTNPGFSACVRECIDDIEQTLKDIDL